MNAPMAAARGLGFENGSGGIFDNGGVFGGGSGGGGGDGGSWYQDWGAGLIGQAGGILTNIFGHNQQQTPQVYPQQNPYSGSYGADSPGSQVSGGISQAWANAAATIGVAPGTLTLMALGAGVLLFMKPPSARRNPARRSNPKRRRRARR